MRLNLGELSLSDVDDANIPVNIFVSEVESHRLAKDGDLWDLLIDRAPTSWRPQWELVADNFMPRKGLSHAYHYVADSKEDLLELVRDRILPMYDLAVNAVRAMAEGKRDSFYYWVEKDD